MVSIAFARIAEEAGPRDFDRLEASSCLYVDGVSGRVCRAVASQACLVVIQAMYRVY